MLFNVIDSPIHAVQAFRSLQDIIECMHGKHATFYVNFAAIAHHPNRVPAHDANKCRPFAHAPCNYINHWVPRLLGRQCRRTPPSNCKVSAIVSNASTSPNVRVFAVGRR